MYLVPGGVLSLGGVPGSRGGLVLGGVCFGGVYALGVSALGVPGPRGCLLSGVTLVLGGCLLQVGVCSQGVYLVWGVSAPRGVSGTPPL